VQFRLPDELRAKEIELRTKITGSLRRGKVECSLHLRRGGAEGAELTLNEDLIRQLGARLEQVTSMIPNAGDLNPVDVLRWPGVVSDPELDMEPLFEEATALLAHTVASLTEMRSAEGGRIAAMLESRLDDILGIAADVQRRMPEVLDAVRTRQRERIDKLNIEADPSRLETELALIAQKLDVAEELDRLESHVSEVRSALSKSEPVGRRLDFLMQEFNREANTLGSKSADTETTKAAVDLKVLIEQMREQIQNVE
jgi:uncharacterized protein (TIGR00255 family)